VDVDERVVGDVGRERPREESHITVSVEPFDRTFQELGDEPLKSPEPVNVTAGTDCYCADRGPNNGR
jgi:hypothetical protein